MSNEYSIFVETECELPLEEMRSAVGEIAKYLGFGERVVESMSLNPRGDDTKQGEERRSRSSHSPSAGGGSELDQTTSWAVSEGSDYDGRVLCGGGSVCLERKYTETDREDYQAGLLWFSAHYGQHFHSNGNIAADCPPIHRHNTTTATVKMVLGCTVVEGGYSCSTLLETEKKGEAVERLVDELYLIHPLLPEQLWRGLVNKLVVSDLTDTTTASGKCSRCQSGNHRTLTIVGDDRRNEEYLCEECYPSSQKTS